MIRIKDYQENSIYSSDCRENDGSSGQVAWWDRASGYDGYPPETEQCMFALNFTESQYARVTGDQIARAKQRPLCQYRHGMVIRPQNKHWI